MEERWVLQFCHSHYGPFLDVARQYAVLFRDTPYKVLTVYLTGDDSAEVRAGSASDEVIFLGNDKKEVRGLKLKAILALRKIIAGRRVELVIAHRFKPIYIACLACKLPVIGVHHAFGDYGRPARRWFVRRFRQRLLLLGVSDAVRDDIRRRLPDWPPERIQTFYNRIDVATVQAEQIDRDAARRHLGLPNEAFVVGNVGRLHSDKDQATLIRGFALALPRLPHSAVLAILGKGPLEARLRALADELRIADKVRFLGQVPNARRYFRAFDIFALTSDHEPFGMVLLEAMAAGIPLACTDCGGAAEIVTRADMKFPLGDTQALAEILVRAAAAPRPAPGGDAANEHLPPLLDRFSDQAATAAFRALLDRQPALAAR